MFEIILCELQISFSPHGVSILIDQLGSGSSVCYSAGFRVRKLQWSKRGESLRGGAGAQRRRAHGGSWGVGGAYLRGGRLPLAHVLPINSHTHLQQSFGVNKKK